MPAFRRSALAAVLAAGFAASAVGQRVSTRSPEEEGLKARLDRLEEQLRAEAAARARAEQALVRVLDAATQRLDLSLRAVHRAANARRSEPPPAAAAGEVAGQAAPQVPAGDPARRWLWPLLGWNAVLTLGVGALLWRGRRARRSAAAAGTALGLARDELVALADDGDLFVLLEDAAPQAGEPERGVTGHA